jgi:hypothetical protein
METVAHLDLRSRLRQHLQEVLAIRIDPQPWAGGIQLPAFRRDLYEFLAARILRTPCLFMIDRAAQPGTPAAIRKHLFEVGRRWDGEVVYVAGAIDSARRKQLIDQGIPFIVPGNQVYLPMFGIDLREHFRKARGAPESFSPATQVVLLHALHQKGGVELYPQEMAAILGYTPMSMSRAFDQLQAAGIGQHAMKGKRRLMGLPGPGRDYWEKTQPMLRTPVVRRVHVEKRGRATIGPAAGASALARYTRLAEPRTPVVAVAASSWASRREELELTEADAGDPRTVEVELWAYRPESVAGGSVVDRLSLYLSLRATADERLEAALDELLEGMEW